MNWRIVFAIFRKEALDTVRDRRTLIMMLGVPIVLYPALMLLMTQVAMVQQASLEEQESRVALGPGTPSIIGDWLREDKRISVSAPEDPAAALSKGDLDVVISAPADFQAQLDARARPVIAIQFDETEFRGREAEDRVYDVLEKTFDTMRESWLAAQGLSEGHVSPFEITQERIATPEKRSGAMLGLILPVLLVVMLALGAFYPAVDLTAGEKERGTFETLLSTPCTKLEIVAGKFITVFGLSMITALLNFLSMAATLMLVISQARGAGPGAESILPQVQFSPLALGAILLVLVPLAFFVSAMMMAVAVFARSFKEAQNYMTPFLLLITLPAAVAGLPGMEMSGITAMVPIVNVVLLFKDLMTGEATADMVFIVLFSTSTFAGLALLFAAWLFQREEVVLGGGAAAMGFRRDELRPVKAPTPGLSLLLFFVVMVLIMYVGSSVQLWNLFVGLLITEYGLILLPCVAALWYFRVDMRNALSLRGVGAGPFAGAIACGLGGLILVIQVGAWHNKVLPVPQELQDAFKALFSEGTTPAGLAKLLLIVAVTPAICEEVLFRGVLYSGLRGRMHPVAVVLLVGFLFGVFHLSIHRFAPTALLGVVLTWIVWRTGSIFPGMLVHMLVNGTSILLATGYFPEGVVKALRLETVEVDGVWWPVLTGGVVLLVGGAGVLEWTRRRTHDEAG